MPEIILPTGETVLIDDCDADLVQLRWHRLGQYVAHSKPRTNGRSPAEYIHRLILSRMLGQELLPGECTDHINGNPLDNRRANLRIATYQQNMQNKTRHADGASGYKGVSFHKPTNKWRSRISHNGGVSHLGLFDTAIEAAIAYNTAALKYHGDFARLNDIPSHLHPTANIAINKETA